VTAVAEAAAARQCGGSKGSSRGAIRLLHILGSRTESDTAAVQVNDTLWDLERPLEGSCTLAFFDFESPEGKRVFWHSSAHVLGEAAERHYGCHLCIGPPTDDGFFYEMGMGESEKIGR
jgi:hypothetical protein